MDRYGLCCVAFEHGVWRIAEAESYILRGIIVHSASHDNRTNDDSILHHLPTGMLEGLKSL